MNPLEPVENPQQPAYTPNVMLNPKLTHTRQTPYGSGMGQPTPRPAAPTSSRPVIPGRRQRIIRIALITFAALLLVGGGFFAYQINRNVNKLVVANDGDSSPVLKYQNSLGGNVDPSAFNKIGDGRLNIVLVGIGGGDHPGANLTDSIQVLSFDALNKKVTTTSIPRDLYVDIPNYGRSKINAAYQAGESEKEGTGGAVLKEVVGKVLGTHISYFALIDFRALEQVVDSIGGIEVTVPKAIYDPYFPSDEGDGYTPFSIKAGTQTMSGKVALRYARSRYTTSDFDRSARQQLIMEAIKKKAIASSWNPVKMSNLLNTLGDRVSTDLQTDEMLSTLSLYQNTANAGSYVLDTSDELGLLTADSSTSAGYIEYPLLGVTNFNDVHRWFFTNNPDPLVTKDAPTVMVAAGNAKVTTKQLTDMVALLNDYGYKATVSDADVKAVTATTLISRTTKKPISRNYLQQLTTASSSDKSVLSADTDFELLYVPTTK